MVSSEYGYILYILPNLLVGLAYLIFLKRPMQVRLMAALPSALFLAPPALTFLLAPVVVSYPAAASMVLWGTRLTGVGAVLLAAFNLFRIRTWLHLLQAVNVFVGILLLYVTSMLITGEAS
jgi:hypothetical protein